MNPHQYIAVVGSTIVAKFKDSEELDAFSQMCTDENVYIYRRGTDFLVDGHTEGYMNTQTKNRR